jgi:hypothetical protein
MADLKFLVDDWPAISGRLDEALALAPQQRDAWLAALDEPDPVNTSCSNCWSLRWASRPAISWPPCRG